MRGSRLVAALAVAATCGAPAIAAAQVQPQPEAGLTLEQAIEVAFADRSLRPMEFGGDQGLVAATAAVMAALDRIERKA